MYKFPSVSVYISDLPSTVILGYVDILPYWDGPTGIDLVHVIRKYSATSDNVSTVKWDMA